MLRSMAEKDPSEITLEAPGQSARKRPAAPTCLPTWPRRTSTLDRVGPRGWLHEHHLHGWWSTQAITSRARHISPRSGEMRRRPSGSRRRIESWLTHPDRVHQYGGPLGHAVPSPHLIASNSYTLAKRSRLPTSVFINERRPRPDIIWSNFRQRNALRVGATDPYSALAGAALRLPGVRAGAFKTQAAAQPSPMR